jgi:hypothetical protein
MGGKPFSLHAEGERVILTGAAGQRQEVQLAPPAEAPVSEAAGRSEPSTNVA